MLKSVAAQTVRPRRRVLADDGSTDGSAQIASDAGWEVVHTGATGQRGRGIAVGRNTIIRHVDTEFLAFLDADDWWEPDHLADSVALLRAHPECVLSFGDFRKTSDGVPMVPPPEVPRRTPYMASPRLAAFNYIGVSAVVARRDAVLAVGGFDESLRLVEDYELWLRLSLHGPFIHRDALSLNYRVHPNQTSHDVRGLAAAQLTIRRDHLTRMRGADPAGGEDLEREREARAGIAGTLDMLWYHGHLAEYERGVVVYREIFGEEPPDVRLRQGMVGQGSMAIRRLLGRVPR
jgi:glycosyltransferase involved in cell wall biosynthesis